MEPPAQTQPERALGLINAAYRGVQDARTCVRFFKRDFAESGNNYRIDTSKIVMWGQGTGGYISLAASTLDTYNKIPITEMPVGKFLTNLDADPELEPMIIEQINGDINGATIVGLSPGGPIPAGDTLALPNHPGYSSDFQLTVNMGGALGDISWLDENSPAVISYHVVNDQFAPYKSAILVVPTTGDAIVEVQGSYLTVAKANTLGLNDAFKDVNGDPFSEAAEAASATTGDEYENGLYPFNIPLNVIGRADGSPWNWWSKEKWDTIPFPGAVALGLPEGTTFHFVASLSDMKMSSEKGRTYIDTIMGYFAPRAFEVLNLRPATTAVTLLDRSVVSLSVSPNPSYGLLTLQSNPDFEMKSVRILDVTGKTVLNRPAVNASKVQIEHNHLTSGTYLVEIRFEKGIVTEKVLLH
ncbi:MAG: T9SS type A sorting domain-containing protein [Saprospiraceae bacterium]|nr:T9SS type A sorting domain-containing protein [Saprospiraceae bacterium]